MAATARLDTARRRSEAMRDGGPASGAPSPWTPLPRFAPVNDDWPGIVTRLGPREIAARIETLRTGDPQFDALLARDARPADALRRLALAHWSAGDPRLAAVLLATAVAMATESAEIWLDLAYALQASGDLAEAYRTFERAVRLDPTPARAWLGLAIAANASGAASRAEEAFQAALARDPASADAGFGFGLLLFEQRRYREATQRWREALANGCRHPLLRVGLGQSLFFLGEFSAAAAALEQPARVASPDPAVVKRHALARLIEKAIESGVEAGLSAYSDLAGEHAETPGAIAKSAFHLLSAYGHRALAMGFAETLSAECRADPEQRYLVDAVAGAKHTRAPRDYIVTHFDRFADVFDRQLVDVLQYRVPIKLTRMVAAREKRIGRALDLGCGTGLAGSELADLGGALVGVDLSPAMLAKAAERGVYDRLVETDLVSFLEETPERFDLLFAADSLIYLGELGGFFRAAARASAPGALLAFNVETMARGDYALRPSGRFSHAPTALLRKAAPWFQPIAQRRAFFRKEAGGRASGALMLMQRRSD